MLWVSILNTEGVTTGLSLWNAVGVVGKSVEHCGCWGLSQWNTVGVVGKSVEH